MANKRFAIGCLMIVLVGLLIVAVGVTGAYNSFVGLDQKVQFQWA